MKLELNHDKLRKRVTRARTAVGRGTRYKLKQGGFDPAYHLPTKNGQCDCSGFVAWSLGMDRWQGRHKHKPWAKSVPWIETSAIVKDATGAQKLFKQIPAPAPGCIVVYGDRFGRQGHTGIVDNVTDSKTFEVIHCSVGNDRVGDAIRRTDGKLFVKAKAIFVVLNEDYEKVYPVEVTTL